MCMKGVGMTGNDRKTEGNMRERAILCIFEALKTMDTMWGNDIHRAVHIVGKCG